MPSTEGSFVQLTSLLPLAVAPCCEDIVRTYLGIMVCLVTYRHDFQM